MTISITEKEYIAITQVLDQVTTDYEAASDEDYLTSMLETIRLVDNVLKKYRKSQMKARILRQVRAEFHRQEPQNLSE